MTKRRLSKQQKIRIFDRQEQQTQTRQAGVDEHADATILAGVVTCHFGQQLEIEALEGETRGSLYRCFQRSNLPALVCGDRVAFAATEEEGSGVVVGLEPRQSVFSRPNASGQLKPVAANIDLVMVVLAPRPKPFLNLLDRYLVAIENLQLNAQLIINKADLLDEDSDALISTIKSRYPALGYPVFTVSAHDGTGLKELTSTLKGRTAVMVGQSGVGKSSLLNTLSPAAQSQVGPLSTGTDKGTHTTTAARLYSLNGFKLVDSPGIREFGLWHISTEQLLEGFIEFRPFLGGCKFRDCSHRHEPGCLLQDAVKSGAISSERLESYFHILGSFSDR